MDAEFSLTDVDAELHATLDQTLAQPAEDLPFRMALLGDWSGRANRRLVASSDELAGWRPLPVDRDNLDEVMSRLGVKLDFFETNDPSQSQTISFDRLDDFHPDRILERSDVFEDLRRTRARLNNHETFSEAAAEVRRWNEAPSRAAPPSSDSAAATSERSPAKAAGPVSESDLLDQILAGKPSDSSSPKHQVQDLSPEISELVKAAVKPHLAPDNEAERDQLIAMVDARINTVMNAILHHPDFQALEAAWRALDLLVMRLDTGVELKLYLLDISFEEFKADLRAGNDLRLSGIYKVLVEQTVGTSGGVPWSVVAANYTFDFADGDSGLIERVSVVANEAGAPFIAASTSHLVGCESLVKTPDPNDWRRELDSQMEEWWASARRLPSANYIGFALPRFLLRLPYGAETDPTEDFNFEEMSATDETEAERDPHSRHESYLWANPAFAVAFLLARGFSENGWDFRPSDFMEIENLPLHVYQSGGGSEIQPCAEVLLTLRAAERIIDRGLMPLLTMKDSDTIRLGMFQSIAGTPLAGRWTQE